MQKKNWDLNQLEKNFLRNLKNIFLILFIKITIENLYFQKRFQIKKKKIFKVCYKEKVIIGRQDFLIKLVDYKITSFLLGIQNFKCVIYISI